MATNKGYLKVLTSLVEAQKVGVKDEVKEISIKVPLYQPMDHHPLALIMWFGELLWERQEMLFGG